MVVVVVVGVLLLLIGLAMVKMMIMTTCCFYCPPPPPHHPEITFFHCFVSNACLSVNIFLVKGFVAEYLYNAEEKLDRQHRRVDIPAHARTAHKGLLQKRLEEDLCRIVPHVPRRPSRSRTELFRPDMTFAMD